MGPLEITAYTQEFKIIIITTMFNYYVAHIGIAGCLADIRLNDIPLYIGEVNDYIAFSLPLNPYLDHNGRQTLVVSILPPITRLQPAKGSVWVEISLFDGENEKLSHRKTIVESQLKYDGQSILSSSLIDIKSFDANIDYPVDRWNDCEKIDRYQNVRAMAFYFYNNLGKIFRNHQYNTYSSMIAHREQEIVKSIGLDEREIQIRDKQLIENLNNGYVFKELRGDEIVHFYAGGKAMALLTPEMDPALRFYSAENDNYLVLDLLLGIRKGTGMLSIL